MRIKFITTAVTHHGTFSTGDIATFGDAFARHCVEEAKCAEYIEPPVPAPAPDPAATPSAPEDVKEFAQPIDGPQAPAVDSAPLVDESASPPAAKKAAKAKK